MGSGWSKIVKCLIRRTEKFELHLEDHGEPVQKP